MKMGNLMVVCKDRKGRNDIPNERVPVANPTIFWHCSLMPGCYGHAE